MKIAICTPIHSTAKAGFVQSLGNLIAFSHRAKFKNQHGHVTSMEMETFIRGHSVVAEARNSVAKAALDWGADWMLWLDSDHTFPRETLGRLLSRHQPIVGCNYRTRSVANPDSTTSRGGVRILPKGDGIEEVDYMGLGVCLISAQVFRRLEPPYFWFTRGPGCALIGEDAYFFEKARAAGFVPYVDHALSRQIGHIADITLTFGN